MNLKDNVNDLADALLTDLSHKQIINVQIIKPIDALNEIKQSIVDYISEVESEIAEYKNNKKFGQNDLMDQDI